MQTPARAAPRLTPLPKRVDGRWGLSIKLSLRKGNSHELVDDHGKAAQLEDEAEPSLKLEPLTKKSSEVESLGDSPVRCGTGGAMSFRTEDSIPLSGPTSGKNSNVYIAMGDEGVNEVTNRGPVYTGKLTRLKEIGYGTEASVHLVELNDDEGRVMVLKEYQAHKNRGFDGNTMIDTIMEEYRLLKSLNHPRIIQYWSLYKPAGSGKYGSGHNSIGMLMEYMEGGSLDEHLAKAGRITPLDLKKKWLRQILQGLLYLHEHKVIHRDLKVIISFAALNDPPSLRIYYSLKTMRISRSQISGFRLSFVIPFP
jgi:serine/threonine protein kinase